MAGHWTDKFTFVDGVVRSRSTAYLALVGDDVAKRGIAQSIFVVWHEGKWLQGASKEWRCTGMAVVKKPIEQLVAIGENGEVLCLGSGDVHDEQVRRGKKAAARGPMRRARRIGDDIFVAGMDRQVHRRIARSEWVDVGPKRKSKDVTGFEAVDGFGVEEIYAAGWGGEIWRYDGHAWEPIPPLTPHVLVDVCCAGDGSVYACGRRGTLVRGHGDAFELVRLDGFDEDVWSLAWHGERLWLATRGGLFTFDGTKIEAVDSSSFVRLSAEDGILWAVGEKDVLSHDGVRWSRID